MYRAFGVLLIFMLKMTAGDAQTTPGMFGAAPSDLVGATLKAEAAKRNRLLIPDTGSVADARGLRDQIKKLGNIYINHALPVDLHETGTILQKGYVIHKIWFQARPGIYATANLYVPEGRGPFPAVVNMHGHWPGGKAGDMVQACAHALALSGYVCINIDAWGSGERTTEHGVPEYHGANLGASLLNLGESLLGDQVADNIRAVDLLCSLAYVDSTRIGATGASGGGNQTMWLSAMDTRIKAAMPVVSVGTFESYIMNSNCVCELLPGGLCLTEEAGVLSLIAPRALKLCSALKDASPTFRPEEMLRSYQNTRPAYRMYHAEDRLRYQLFDTTHGYWPEMRGALLGWMDLHLKGKGDGSPRQEPTYHLFTEPELMVFSKGNRDGRVKGIAAYCAGAVKKTGTPADPSVKRNELRALLGVSEAGAVRILKETTGEPGTKTVILEGDSIMLTALTISKAASDKYVILLHPGGADSLPETRINSYQKQGYNIIRIDLWGTGASASPAANRTDGSLPRFHTLARSVLWMGETVIGKWVAELDAVARYLEREYHPGTVLLDAEKETAVAALLYKALHPGKQALLLRYCPLSYAFDQRTGIDIFSMAIHLPGLLPWGDLLSAVMLTEGKVGFSQPVTMSGRTLSAPQLNDFKQRVASFGGVAAAEFLPD